jgi:hypothetical protein
MLTPEEAAAFHASIDRVARRAKSGLDRVQGAEGAVEFVVNLHRGIDQVADRAARDGPPPDCRAGCAHCCSVRVEATEPEVLRIVHWLRAQSPGIAAAALQALRQPTPAGQRRPCAFLAPGDVCAIYAVRPATCRKAHSLSVDACAAFEPTLPQNLRRVVDAEALMAGTSAAYRQCGLPSSAHELQSAVLTALEDDTAQARWFAGQAVF